MEGITTDEASKMKIDQLTDELKKATDALEAANQKLAQVEADEVKRIKTDILGRSGFKEAELEGKPLEALRLIEASLDKVGATAKSAGIKKSIDERKNTDGLTVGRYNPATKSFVGGI